MSGDYSAPRGHNNDWFSIQDWEWRSAILAVGVIIAWTASSVSPLLIAVVGAVTVLLEAPLNGTFVFRHLAHAVASMKVRFVHKGVVHKETPSTNRLAQPKPNPSIELEFVLVKGGGVSQVLSVVPSPAGEIHYAFIEPDVGSPRDVTHMTDDELRTWNTAISVIGNILAREAVERFGIHEWRLPHNTRDQRDLLSRTLDPAIRQAIQNDTIELLPEVDRNQTEVLLENAALALTGTDIRNVISITIPSRLAWGGRRPTSLPDTAYRKTRLFRLKRELEAALSPYGLRLVWPSPLQLITALKSNLNPQAAERYYAEQERNAKEYRNDVLNSPSIQEGAQPELVAISGPGLRINASQFAIRWVSKYHDEEQDARSGNSFRVGVDFADGNARVSHSVIYQLVPAKWHNWVSQQKVFTLRALRDNPDRLVSEKEALAAEDAETDLRRRVRSRERWLAGHTRYLVASSAYIPGTTDELDTALKRSADSFGTTRGVLLEADRWPVLLTALLGFHLEET